VETPRPGFRPRLAAARPLAALAAAALAALAAARSPRALPPIVFVSRQPIAGATGAIPGLGPHDRAAAPGGRLLLREPGGRLRVLLPPGRLFDVGDPAVSFGGDRVAFAGTPHPDSGWRIFVVGLDGRGLAQVSPAAAGDRRFDDLDPCWLSDSVLAFASTRLGWRSQYADLPVTEIYRVRLDGSRLARLTAELNGAEEPTLDPRTGALIYARWWFNRYRAAAAAPGLTTDAHRALPGDSVNLWQAVRLEPGGRGPTLAAGAIGSRRGTMAYQPAVLEDGTLAGVYALNLGLSPRAGGTGVQCFPGRFGAARRIAGVTVDDSAAFGYGDPRGLAAPSACAPAGLKDGRLLIACDRGARGDFGIDVVDRDGEELAPVVDLPGTLELDPAPVERRAPPPRGPEFAALDGTGTFTYECRDVFAAGPCDGPVPEGPRLAAGLAIRFYALRAREAAGGDTAVLLREAPVDAHGAVVVAGLPAGTPLFEQLVGGDGLAVMTAHGPAHVAGANFGVPDGVSRCVGCHLGHSSLPVPRDAEAARWGNRAASAVVTASSTAAGGAGPRAAVDRLTRGDPERIAWIAGAERGAWLRLEWPMPLELREVVLHPVAPDRATHTELAIAGATLVLRRGDREVLRRAVPGRLAAGGTRVPVGPLTVDALEVRFGATSGTVRGRRAASLAEIETIARLP
jgi:hypothetical protein